MPTRPLIRAEFNRFKRQLVIFCIFISLGCAGGLYAVYHESTVRAKQFCELTVARANDTVQRFDATIDFLNSPAGLENTPLNKVIRERSLPTLKEQVNFDKAHRATVCLKYGYEYQTSKYPRELELEH